MDYESFKRFRKDVLRTRSPLRLDCMNPVRALQPIVGRTAVPKEAAGTIAEALAAWSRATGMTLVEGRFAVGTGIRRLLATTLEILLGQVDELWFPQDVYPVYGELARATPLALHSFRTLPEPDWSFLAGANPRAVVLLPYPLTPLGRFPTAGETEALASWLRAGLERLLIVDAVYTYDFPKLTQSLEPLLATEKCITLWSCSKSWLRPGTLGVAVAPHHLAEALARHAEAPSSSALADALAALKGQPELPRLQREAFDRQWKRLAPRIRAACPAWRLPSTGYFSFLPVPSRRLLDKHDLLAVPASVFGSAIDSSVVTCLHNLALHDEDGAP